MGTVAKGFTVLALMLGSSLTANAANYVAADNSIESEICVLAATASKAKMNDAVKKIKPGLSLATMANSYRLVANQLYCNGVDVAEFAMQAGNDSVAHKFQRYQSENVQIQILPNLMLVQFM